MIFVCVLTLLTLTGMVYVAEPLFRRR